MSHSRKMHRQDRPQHANPKATTAEQSLLERAKTSSLFYCTLEATVCSHLRRLTYKSWLGTQEHTKLQPRRLLRTSKTTNPGYADFLWPPRILRELLASVRTVGGAAPRPQNAAETPQPGNKSNPSPLTPSRTWLQAALASKPQPPTRTTTTNLHSPGASTGRSTAPSLRLTAAAALCLHPAPCLCPELIGSNPAVPPTPIGERLETRPHDEKNVLQVLE
jgi:hypothetical protein